MNTIKIFLFLVLPVMLTASTAAAIYRWVDANGQVNYSDQPQSGAEEVVVRKPNISESRRPLESEGGLRGASEGSEQSSESTASKGYTLAQIDSPSKDQVLWNIGGRLRVSLLLEPALQRGHKVMFVLDGRPVSDQPTERVSAVIDSVFRGSHAIRASIYSDTGQVIKTSDTVNFFVKQGTVSN